MILRSLITLSILFLSNLCISQELATFNLGWNHVTLKFLEKKKGNSVKSDIEKIQNTIDAFRESIKYYDDQLSIDTSSPRYSFLKKIATEFEIKLNGKFIIVETVLSGEVNRIYNYLIIPSEDRSTINKFRYTKQGWQIEEKWQVASIELPDLFDQKDNKRGSGSNEDDIIVTYFNSLRAKSYFFMPFTLSYDNFYVKLASSKL